MCGILLNISDESIGADHPALETIRHRGPDGFGVETFDCGTAKLSLGHRRLSIIDLSESGHQPMSYDKGRLWIVFNGEIYNYREIRKELEGEGFGFKSSCDTEVILAAYNKWGRNCLHKFNGMFAFVIYDDSEKRLFIARDRFGIKPAYYVNTPKCFRIASEIKQFVSIPDFKPEVNRIKLYHFLNSGDFEFDDDTMWKGVHEIEPGCFTEIDLKKWRPGNGFKIEKWYEPPFFEPRLKIGFEDAVCEFRRLLQDSVKLRLRSDVPVGFLLSGGIDSSTLVGLAHLMPGERSEHLKTYSTCYDGSDIDEREYINEMLKFTGADSCLHFPKPEDVAAKIDKVIWHNDVPVLHGSPTVHWLLYQRIKEENDARKVIVEGQGGDEIMCGYGDFHWAFLNETLHSRPYTFIKQLKTFQKFHDEPWKIIVRKMLRVNFPSSVKYPPNPLLRPETLLEKDELRSCRACAGCRAGKAFRTPPIAIRREEPTVAELHRNRFKILRYILHNVDRNSMAHSREARVPFLDYRLVEFCLKLPSELKISGGHTKRVLRESAKQVIPSKIAERVDKQGYSSPVAMWAKSGLKDFFRSEIANFAELPFADSKRCCDSFEAYIAGKSHLDPVIWRILSVSKWMKIFQFCF